MMLGNEGTTNTPAVAVVVPLFNKARTVERAVRSVLAQSMADFELVVVDDGSTDASVDIVGAICDPRIRLVKQRNSGPGAARNRGIAETSAPSVAFLDADDEWCSDYLQCACKSLQAHRDCTVAAFGYTTYPAGRQDSLRPGKTDLEPGPWRLPRHLSPYGMKRAVETLCTATVICQRTVLETFGGFYENHCTYGEESYLWLKLVLTQTIYRDPTPMALYHTEDSELGIHGRELPPVRPALTDPDPIRAVCPVQYRELLEDHLAFMALLTARRHLQGGDSATARWAVAAFPRMRRFAKEYAMLRYEMLAEPALRRLGSERLLRVHRRVTGWRRTR